MNWTLTMNKTKEKQAQDTLQTMRFRDLPLGATFDFLNDSQPMFNSFYDRCQKTSARTYVSVELNPKYDGRYQIGSINCQVYHVKKESN
jgi:hypothetical protein